MRLGQYDSRNGDGGSRIAPARSTGPDTTRGSEANGADELERVRDLLVGIPMAEVRAEVDELAQLVAGSSGDMREILNRRLALFEKAIQTKLDRFGSRIQTEACQRLDGQTRLKEQLEEQKHALEIALDTIGNQIEEGSANLTAQLHGQGRLFSDSIRRTASELSKHFDREFEMMSRSRADRSALARVVHELAVQLETEEP